MRIGVDLLGSDAAPDVLMQALRAAQGILSPDVTLVAVATEDFAPADFEDFQFISAVEAIEMGDEPLHAIRRKKRASMVLGIQALAKRRLDAFISAGNTGALVAAATLHLPKLPWITRPGLLAELPTREASLVVMDVGGQVNAEAKHLVRFACFGVAFQRCLNGLERPRVGLLNVGEESGKGNRVTKTVYQRLAQLQKENSVFPFSFVGNIEGREVFQGAVDVLVSDGFTGNVFLKASEGVSLFLLEEFKKVQDPRSDRFLSFEKRIQPSEYPGAVVGGVDGLVVKCHGAASVESVTNAILGAYRLLSKNLIHSLRHDLSRLTLV